MTSKEKSLLPHVLKIVHDKATEPPYSEVFSLINDLGTYICRQCGLALFRSQSKFKSGCGWPSFDEEIPNTIKKVLDFDGIRTEILCARCDAHLGHVFLGEGFTIKNLRHCVNSLSLEFILDNKILDTEEAVYAAGCFWGVEYYFKKLPGVLKTEVGYTGGSKQSPSYEEVCYTNTGHFEAIRIVYDPLILNYEKLTQYFFEIHDPTQIDGQGPDIGPQYQSAIFNYNEAQRNIAEDQINFLKGKGMQIATQILSIKPFWPAEEYHQNYYDKTKKNPYCHIYTKRF